MYLQLLTLYVISSSDKLRRRNMINIITYTQHNYDRAETTARCWCERPHLTTIISFCPGFALNLSWFESQTWLCCTYSYDGYFWYNHVWMINSSTNTEHVAWLLCSFLRESASSRQHSAFSINRFTVAKDSSTPSPGWLRRMLMTRCCSIRRNSMLILYIAISFAKSIAYISIADFGCELQFAHCIIGLFCVWGDAVKRSEYCSSETLQHTRSNFVHSADHM